MTMVDLIKNVPWCPVPDYNPFNDIDERIKIGLCRGFTADKSGPDAIHSRGGMMGKWVIGLISFEKTDENDCYIAITDIEGKKHRVFLDSISRYALTDTNGFSLFGGDYVCIHKRLENGNIIKFPARLLGKYAYKIDKTFLIEESLLNELIGEGLTEGNLDDTLKIEFFSLPKEF